MLSRGAYDTHWRVRPAQIRSPPPGLAGAGLCYVGRSKTGMLATAAACARCLGPFGSGSRCVRLLDLSFHEVCVPSCRNCGNRLSDRDEDRWSYAARVISASTGYSLEPTEFWCQECWEL